MRIEKLACVGAGLIGQGWATVFISKGFETVLQDVSKKILDTAIRNITVNLQFLQANGLLDQIEVEGALDRIRTTTQIEEAAQADYVQESVSENREVKKMVLKKWTLRLPPTQFWRAAHPAS
jgi:3-hydroxybutyryl-CoA dehydrogenase